uniref:Uncharacterized protein n=1 Tax=Magnetococcus massalia (strain MO-1) TaxID=451514 RepID=A0A1S7LCP3_MAGMO|nr:protein of unknown function [Candidatus Magnetococcus massalia]
MGISEKTEALQLMGRASTMQPSMGEECSSTVADAVDPAHCNQPKRLAMDTVLTESEIQRLIKILSPSMP